MKSLILIKGQVMLLTVVLLSGTVLGTTAIAGLLMTYELRQATLATDSAKAIFAADTGLEWQLYRAFKDPTYARPRLTNGAEFATRTSSTTIIAIGYADAKHTVARSFEAAI